MFCPHRVKIALATAPPLPQNPNKIRGMVDILIVFVLQDTSNHSRNFKPHGLADMQCVSGFFFLSIQRMKNAFAEIVWLSDYHCKGKQSSYLYLRRGILFLLHCLV